MANYYDLEYEFVERTLALIAQYEAVLHNYSFEEQYNHTLLLNCLLGLIVMPNERIFSFIPNDRLTEELKREIGLPKSKIDIKITTLRQLINQLRNSIAHFDLKVISKDDQFLIDEIIFCGEDDSEIIRFESSELLPFVRYYGSWLLSNLKNYRSQ